MAGVPIDVMKVGQKQGAKPGALPPGKQRRPPEIPDRTPTSHTTNRKHLFVAECPVFVSRPTLDPGGQGRALLSLPSKQQVISGLTQSYPLDGLHYRNCTLSWFRRMAFGGGERVIRCIQPAQTNLHDLSLSW